MRLPPRALHPTPSHPLSDLPPLITSCSSPNARLNHLTWFDAAQSHCLHTYCLSYCDATYLLLSCLLSTYITVNKALKLMDAASFHRPLAYPDARSYPTASLTRPDRQDIPVKRKRSWEDPSNSRLAVPNISNISTYLDMETYNGHVRTPADAILLFEACRLGLLPRVQRRLSEKERQSIKSGSVFVWDEREAGMRLGCLGAFSPTGKWKANVVAIVLDRPWPPSQEPERLLTVLAAVTRIWI